MAFWERDAKRWQELGLKPKKQKTIRDFNRKRELVHEDDIGEEKEERLPKIFTMV
ncbi:MAG: hypothetical protein U5K79_03510 [Cyclobacteriaceae bacterium]|nr:hypothetical protein [Cyclobacteriaceae bacterium]